ncbi:LysR family transcriptional regulator [bacterium]|nr:LysR family transcriptional regulator [candidate division CSSED10-310 bacterium]
MKLPNESIQWTLNHIRMFCVLSQTGSLSETAGRMGLTQPAVTQKLKQMETAIGIRLWKRRGRKSGQLTEAGLIFSRYAEEILDMTGRLLRDLKIETEPYEIPAAASTIPGERLLPEILAEISRRLPGVRVRMRITDSERVVRLVADAEVLIGFCGLKPSRPDLTAIEFARDDIVFVVGSGHPLATRAGPISFRELSGHSIVLREPGSGTRMALETKMERAAMELPRDCPMLELGSSQSVFEAIDRNLGVGFISGEAAGGLKQIHIRGLTPITRRFYIIFRTALKMNPDILRVMELIRSHFKTVRSNTAERT